MKHCAVYPVLFVLLISCGISGEAIVHTEESTAAHAHQEMQGTFSSKKGIMHPVSCYGYNIGLLKTDGGENVTVCFDRLETGKEAEVPAGPIFIKGYFENTTREASPESPCEAGTRKVFYVEEWHEL